MMHNVYSVIRQYSEAGYSKQRTQLSHIIIVFTSGADRRGTESLTINVTVKKMYNYWLKDKILETLRKKKETYALTTKFKNTDQ